MIHCLVVLRGDARLVVSWRPLIGFGPFLLPGGEPTLPTLRPQWIAAAYGVPAFTFAVRRVACGFSEC
jgi:hypothetical protein